MSHPSFVAFIDESGCDGDKFGRGSSNYLILSAAVGFEAITPRVDEVIELVRHAAGKDGAWTPPKFDKCNGAIKWALCHQFAQIDFFTAHILIHKPSINDAALRTDRNRLYRYGSKLLLERISWICKSLEHPLAPGNGKCRIVFSQDRSRSYQAFKDYVARLHAMREYKAYKEWIDWDFIDPDLIEDLPFRTETGLLLADFHASAMGLALEERTYGQYDERYARILGEKILKSRKKGAFGLGYKFWPREAETLLDTEPMLDWMKRV